LENKDTYEHLLKIQKECVIKMRELIEIHETDPDLTHKVGHDPYCQYCDQYNELNIRLKAIRMNIQAYEKENTTNSQMPSNDAAPKKKRIKYNYSIFDIILKNGDQFLIYSDSLENAIHAIKQTIDDISHSTIIQKEYYPSLYLEDKKGNVTNLKLIVDGLKKKIYVIAEKEQTKNRVKGLCYNEVPFEFFKYSIERLDKFKKFCGENVTITRAKKQSEYKRGKLNVQGSRGSFPIENGLIAIKTGNGIIYTLTPEEFNEQFSEDEALSWNNKIE